MYGNKSYLDGGPSLSSMYAEAYRNDPALSRGIARARASAPRRTPMGPGELRNALNQPLSSMYAESYRNDPSLAQGMVRRR